MSDKVDAAIGAADGQPVEADTSTNVEIVAQLGRDPRKAIKLSVPQDFSEVDCAVIMYLTVTLLKAADDARQNPLAKAGLLVPDKKIVRIS